MKTRYLVGGIVSLLIVAVLLAIIPSSPFYLPEYLNSGEIYEGRSVSSWSKDLTSSDPEVRRQGALALGAIGEGAAKTVPTLAKLLSEDSDANVRASSAFAIMKIGTAATDAIPSLIKGLDDEEKVVRFNSAVAIRIIGPAAKSAAPVLIKVLKEERNQVQPGDHVLTIQDVIALALGKVTTGTKEGVPSLMEALKSTKTAMTRKSIIRALGSVGSEAKEALPLIKEFKSDSNIEVRESVEICIQQIEQ